MLSSKVLTSPDLGKAWHQAPAHTLDKATGGDGNVGECGISLTLQSYVDPSDE